MPTNSNIDKPKRMAMSFTGGIRPLTPEEIAMPDIDRPFLSEALYKDHKRKCIHCGGELRMRILGMAFISKEPLKYHLFGFVFCPKDPTGHEPPYKQSEREREHAEWSKNNTKEYAYYVKE